MTIVICGSMSASKEMLDFKTQLTHAGHVVVLPKGTEEYAAMPVIKKSYTESARRKIDNDFIRGHYEEISRGDAVFIVNVERHGIPGYIGGNAFLEMGFAYVLRKKIFLLYEIPDMTYQDELVAMEPIILHGDVTKIT